MWKDVNGYNNYEISDEGFVRNKKSGRILRFDTFTIRPGRRKPTVYLRVTLCEDNTPRKFAIHRLVALHFLECENPEGLEVNHKDGNRYNNHVSNLEWVTKEENHQHALDNGLTAIGRRNGRAVYTEEIVREVRRLSRSGYSRKETAAMTGTTLSFVKDVRGNRTWTHVED